MGKLLTTATTMLCPHGGSVSAISSNAVANAGAAILRVDDTFLVSGCAFNISGAPHPCMTVEWQNPSQKTKAASGKALTTDSIGMCKAADQAAQGVASIVNTQAKASAL